MSFAVVDGVNGLPKAVLTRKSGAKIEVYLHGAHLTSWCTADGVEHIFVSKQAVFSTDKAIRGGIPVCWPQFANQGPLPAHGFARNSNDWVLLEYLDEESDDNSTNPLMSFSLRDSEKTREIWPNAFQLKLEFELGERELKITMTALNENQDRSFSFSTALHSYFMVDDISTTVVRGLEGARYIDKVSGGTEKLETREVVDFAGEVDSKYLRTLDELVIAQQQAGQPEKAMLAVCKQGFPDAVVWNPDREKARSMNDMAEEEFAKFVCVEAGIVDENAELTPGNQWSGVMTLKAL